MRHLNAKLILTTVAITGVIGVAVAADLPTCPYGTTPQAGQKAPARTIGDGTPGTTEVVVGADDAAWTSHPSRRRVPSGYRCVDETSVSHDEWLGGTPSLTRVDFRGGFEVERAFPCL